ncbi:MAG: NAD(+)/NADH kinase [Deltaproteobacteria bacterium]|nr:NAD(+)/NADH kinase [Deltaproteobacteria bacterium]
MSVPPIPISPSPVTTTTTTRAGTAALYRGRFDPPGLHHVETLKALLARFDRVVVMPWGPMPDRPIDENVAPAFRARLIDIAFQRLDPRIVVDLTDIEHATISGSEDVEKTSSWLQDRKVFHVVEAASFAEDVARLHPGATVVVVATTGAAVPPGEFPVVRVEHDVAGAVMRKRLYEGLAIDDLVPTGVAQAIARHGLYRGMPRTVTRLRPREPRLLLVADERNEKAVRWAQRFAPWAVVDDPNLIVVFGGDGSMLHAIQQHWRKRVPFLGINAGHLGFLLNDPNGIVDDDDAVAALWHKELLLHHMPMLHVELLERAGGWRSGLTFNDAWIERSTGQSAWIEVKVDGRVRLPKLVCDGVLVSTAAGSTAYARSMGATPLLADTAAWLLVGSNVMDPILWKSALLSTSSVVEMRSLHVEKRPLTGFLHGVSMGEITEMRARLSRAASVELAFVGAHDMAEKIARIQFPG